MHSGTWSATGVVAISSRLKIHYTTRRATFTNTGARDDRDWSDARSKDTSALLIWPFTTPSPFIPCFYANGMLIPSCMQ